jgi:outer membrane protein assembly factor BamB
MFLQTIKLKEKKRKMSRSKIKAFAIAIFLILSIGTSMMLVPAADAHDPAWEITTYAFINVAPDPVGQGQTVNVLMWLDKVIQGAAAANDIRFENYKLTITDPDGGTETETWDVCEDTTSSQYYAYVPSKVGEYTFEFEFPGQTYDFGGAYDGDEYTASSAETTLTVQEEKITAISGYPLPQEYWARPIYGENTDWWTISSNWLGTGSPEFKTINFAYNVAIPGAVGSQTSHIMWTRPLQSGGVVGDDNFVTAGDTYMEGTAYLNRFTNPIIMAGKLYYREPLNYGSSSGGPTVCIDLRTGEEIWSRTDVHNPSFGYIYSFQSMNYHGVMQPTLIAAGGGRGSSIPSGMWIGYDGDTGEWLFNATDVPSGTKAMGPQGEYLQYIIQNYGTVEEPDYRLLQWNSSKLGTSGMMATGAILGEVNGGAASCYDWNVSIDWRNDITDQFTVGVAYGCDIMLCYEGALPSGGAAAAFGRAPSSTPYTYYGINLNPDEGTLGKVLWDETYTAPEGNVTVFLSGSDPESGVFIESHKETRRWVGYNLRTGKKMWGPTESQTSFDYYGDDFGGVLNAQMADGRFYHSAMAGIVYCYNATTGDLLWTYGNGGEGNSTSSGYQLAYGAYPTMIEAIGNGVIYTSVIEHTVNTPIYKGARTRAINATDGTEVYTLSNFGSSWTQAIADGYTTFMNGYDNQIYTVGKGPSATTVSAGPEVSVEGDKVLVKGTVIDISAGTGQNEQAARFPAGVPAVCDDNMSDWMEYVYMQRPRPADIVGVEVVISVLDPNNNCYEVARTASDASGFFSVEFEPEVPGKYTVIATFEGSKGYWPSDAETAVYVEAAPAATPAATPVPQEPVGTYFTISTVLIIVAIAIGVFLLLRRR